MLVFVFIPACSTVPPQAVDPSQSAELHDINAGRIKSRTDWSLKGKLAIRNDKDGGSGKFQWSESLESSRMDFHGAMGRGAWRMLADDQGARLELADGETHQAGTIDQLVRSQIGWTIPIDSLAWWVRGLAAPGDAENRLLDEKGNLVHLNQNGWVIEYGKYGRVGDISLPVRLTAQQANWKVKLVVRQWELSGEKGPDD